MEDTGHSVPELFAERGEAAFRAEEERVLTEALRHALEGDQPVVVSVAGGAVLRPDNRALLRASGTVVWLRARVSTLARRVGDGAGRPLLGDDPAAALAGLSEVRRPLYEEVATSVIDVDDLGPDEVADRLVALMVPIAAAAEGRARA